MPELALVPTLLGLALLRLHGDGYAAYAARVGRFLPGVGRLARRD